MSPKIDVLAPCVALQSASVVSRDKSYQRMWLSMSPRGSKQKLLPLTMSCASGWQFSHNKIQNTCPLMKRIYLLQTMKFFDKILYLILQTSFMAKPNLVGILQYGNNLFVQMECLNRILQYLILQIFKCGLQCNSHNPGFTSQSIKLRFIWSDFAAPSSLKSWCKVIWGICSATTIGHWYW